MNDKTERQKKKRAKTHEITLLCLRLNGDILDRCRHSNRLLYYRRRRNPFAACFRGPRRHRCRCPDCVGAAPCCVWAAPNRAACCPFAAHSVGHLARQARDGRRLALPGTYRFWAPAAVGRRLLAARNLRAGHRHFETKPHGSLFCAI